VNDSNLTPESRLAGRRARSWLSVLAVVLVVLLGGLLRFGQAGESLWLDELHSSWVVADSLADVAPRARAGNQSPLYFYLVWGVLQLVGPSTWSLRFVSLCAGTLLVLSVAWLVDRWSRAGSAALLAALLVAIDRDCIFYAQEARPYALLQLSALWHAALFVTLLRRPTWPVRCLFILGAAWLFHLHYTALLFLLAESVCLIALWLLRSPGVAYQPRQALVDAAAVGLLLLPAMSHLPLILERRENWARIVQPWPPPYSLQKLLVLCGLIPSVALLVGRWCGIERSVSAPAAIERAWGACWFLVPLIVAWITTLVDLAALCMVRYVVTAVAGAIVFAALCHSFFRSRVYRSILAIILLAGLLGHHGILTDLRHEGRAVGDRTEAWDEATQWLAGRLQQRPCPVFLFSDLLEDAALLDRPNRQLRQYCLFPVAGIYHLPMQRVEPLPTTRHVELTISQRERVRRGGGVWLLLRNPRKAGPIANAVAGQLRAGGVGVELAEHRQFGSLTVLRLDVHDATERD